MVENMKLQRTPLILLAIALLFGGGVYIYEIQGSQKRQEAQSQSGKLFSFQEADVQTLSLQTPDQSLLFARVPRPPASPSPATSSPAPTIWQMQRPSTVPANDASVSYLLNLMTTGRSEQMVKSNANQLAVFGLDKPLATIEVKLSNQQSQRLVLGKPDFNRSALYALVNPPPTLSGEVSISLVPIAFETAVRRPLLEWQATPPTPKK